jgi:hypothetical protein
MDARLGTQASLVSALFFAVLGLSRDPDSALFSEPWFIPVIVAVLWTSLKSDGVVGI